MATKVLPYLYAIVKQYPPKIIVAWGEAISGNLKIREWLAANNYPELAIFSSALNLNEDAREWLMKNGHTELMALVMGAEGDEKACVWLRANGFKKVALMAEGADNDQVAIEELLKGGHQEWVMISMKIRGVKNAIQRDQDDWHTYSTR